MNHGELKLINLPTDIKRDWEKADKFFPSIVQILQSIYGLDSTVEVAPSELDLERATDYLLTLKSETQDILVACRVRDLESFKKYGDITIRSRRLSGAKTELEKLAEGFGDIYFYGWGIVPNISEYVVWSLDAMRPILQLRYYLLKKGEIVEIPNIDGRSWFIAISHFTLENNRAIISSSRAH